MGATGGCVENHTHKCACPSWGSGGGKDTASPSVGHILHYFNGMCMVQLSEHVYFYNTNVVTPELESSHRPHNNCGKYPSSER